MKKIFTILLTVILALTTLHVTVFAEDQSEFIDSGKRNFEGQTTLDYHAYSTYSVSIPTNIGIDNPTGTVSVTMDNIEQGYHVDVYITNLGENGFLTVTSDSGDTGLLSVMYDNGMRVADQNGLIGTFTPEAYGNTGIASTNIMLDKAMVGNFKAGIYHGVISFRVECVPDAE